MSDVFDFVQAGKPAPIMRVGRAARLVYDNKGKIAIMVSAGVATAFVTAATGGVALAGVGVYVAGKAAMFTGKRTWRWHCNRRYMEQVNAIVRQMKFRNNGESLSAERKTVDGPLVARETMTPLLAGIRNEVQHSDLRKVMNDYVDFEAAKLAFDLAWGDFRYPGERIDCHQAIQLVEGLGKMARQYHRIAEDFELIAELATFMVLHKSRMDEEFRGHIDTVMSVLSECYPRTKQQFDNPLVDLLNEAANSSDVLGHWNEWGGKDHRAWVGAVMDVEGKRDFLPKYLARAERGQEKRYRGIQGAPDPYSGRSRDIKNESGALGAKLGAAGGMAGGKVGSNALQFMKFDPTAIGPLALVSAGEAVLGLGAGIANAEWNRYMLRTKKTLSLWGGGRDLTEEELVKLYRGEAKKDIQAMVDKFEHLLTAHQQWYEDSVQTYSRGFETLLVPAAKLLRRQKLYWQIFHASSGLFANFAQFYEKVALPVIVAENEYLRDGGKQEEVEKKIRESLSEHAKYAPCMGACYMTGGQLAEWANRPADNFLRREQYANQPIAPLGARLQRVTLE